MGKLLEVAVSYKITSSSCSRWRELMKATRYGRRLIRRNQASWRLQENAVGNTRIPGACLVSYRK